MSIFVAGLLAGFAGGFISAGAGVGLFLWRRQRRALAVRMVLGNSDI
ncbi:hypothetical protein NO263_05940 [Gluconacetobacter entanii]|uniref:Uncharacterized protein n=1 Tax=Gluconacetobacter entanii TaxID=108528 RepID=A0ABT3K3X4_9PROT|nr:hypothetical protein [Gluconacetobacter entanii]MCW4590120.1 hypothetical protein [Gluconacetobacter entanii]MCW4594735.1 hypothetical protein [Gluconacetobacter entanii]NPC89296.1 hypothetical protein [Gluconacetobacter entanii]